MRPASDERRRLRRRRTPPFADAAGITIVGLALAWTIVSATISGGDPGPSVAFLVATTSAFVFARAVTAWRRSLVPLGVIGIMSLVIAQGPGDVFSRDPRGGPFGFSSLTGGFFMLGTIAALMIVGQSKAPWLKTIGVAVASVFGSVTVVTRSRAPAALVVLALIALVLVSAKAVKGRTMVVGFGGLFITALMTALLVGLSYTGAYTDEPRNGAASRFFDSTLTERRAGLWHDAVNMMLRRPLAGVGPGRFAEFSPVVHTDPDEPWAHNDFLQAGAEMGFPGFALLTLLFLWGFWRLAVASRADVVTVLGAAALCALAVHASIEKVLPTLPISIVAAALLGTGVGKLRWMARAQRAHLRGSVNG